MLSCSILLFLRFLPFLQTSLAIPVISPLVPIERAIGRAEPDSYIVTLKAGVDKASHFQSLDAVALRTLIRPSDYSVIHNYTGALHGYAAILRGKILQSVLSSPDVAFVEENGIVTLDTPQRRTKRSPVQEGRGGSRKELNFAHTSSSNKLAKPLAKRAGDTGIYVAHSDFGGRASWGYSSGYAQVDGNGHGTHVAAVAIGTKYGIAKGTNAIAVKVLSDTGSGTLAGIIAGIDYALSSAKSNAGIRASIINISVVYSGSTTLDAAVTNVVVSGYSVTVPAGDTASNAGAYSPARAPAATTVGALDSTGTRSPLSNFGPLVDEWALGVNVISAWIGSVTATNTLSGTSIASPHIAGVLAVALGG